MAKQCRFCGAEMDDNAIKCPECEKAVAGAEILINKQRQKAKKKTIVIIVLIIYIVLIIGLAVIAMGTSKNKSGAKSYVDAIDMNISAMIDDDPNKFLKSYPEFMQGVIKDTLGSLTETGFDEYMELLSDEIVKSYGSDVSVSYNILDKQHLDDDAINDYLTSIFDYIDDYNMEDYPAQDAYQLGLEITFSGSIGNQKLNTMVAVMEFDGSWYIMNIINPINTSVDTQQ